MFKARNLTFRVTNLMFLALNLACSPNNLIVHGSTLTCSTRNLRLRVQDLACLRQDLTLKASNLTFCLESNPVQLYERPAAKKRTRKTADSHRTCQNVLCGRC